MVIISVPGQRDCSSLVTSISSVSPLGVYLLKASLPNNKLNPSDVGITEIESAISRSHHRAREQAFKMGADWALILEDDAIATSELHKLPHFLEQISSIFNSKVPLGIHLAPEQFGVMIGNRSDIFVKSIYLADCAVAYILNKVALESCLNSGPPVLEVADWPRVLRKFQWISPLKPMFVHPYLSNSDSKSASVAPRLLRNQGRSLIQKFIKYPYLIMLRFWLASWLGSNYGVGFVESEKIRSKVIRFHSSKND